MRVRLISLFFVLAMGVVTVIFHHKPPRRQGHLAALEATVDSALQPFPATARFFYHADSSTAQDYAIWCRLFAAPRRLLLVPAKSGDTVFYLRSRNERALTGFSEKPVQVDIQFFIQS